MMQEIYAYILFILAVVPITVYFNQILFFSLSFYFSITHFHRKRNTYIKNFPGVSIVKPLMGVDPLLRENLVSHFELKYPQFEIILCVEDICDPAVDFAKSIINEYSDVDARLIVGGNTSVINPMVANFLPGYDAAKYDLVWVSTSRIRASTCIMEDLVEKSLNPSVALVHQLPFYSDQPGFLAAIEKICFGCALGRSSMALNCMGMLCFTGMSYILKKSILEKFGGFTHFGKYLAEDFFFSKALHDSGYQLVMSDYPAQQNVQSLGLSSYVNRMVRWLRLRINMLTVVALLFEPLIECLNLGFLISISLNYLFNIALFKTFCVHVCIWIFLDYMLLRCVQNGPLPFSIFTFLLAWWSRELLTYLIYVKALIHPRTVKWGIRTYILSLGGHTQLASNYAVKDQKSSFSNGILSPPIVSTNWQPSLFMENQTNQNDSEPLSVNSNGVNYEFIWRYFPPNGYIRGAVRNFGRKIVGSTENGKIKNFVQTHSPFFAES